MGKSQETYNKKENEKKRRKKKKAKEEKREARKEQAKDGSLDNMMAYLDENGNIVDAPPDPAKKKKIKAEDIEISVTKQEKEITSSIRKGKVEFYNDAKGYGFIKDFDSQEKYFFHVNGTIDDIGDMDKVTFELERGMKGMQAVRVKLT